MIRLAIRYTSQEPAFLSVPVSTQYRLPHVSVHSTILFQGCIALLAITGLLAISPAAVMARESDILGLRLGMDLTEVIAALKANGMAPSQDNGETVTAKGPPVPLQGVKEMKCSFKGKRLDNVVLSFEIPPHEATAANLIQRYENEKSRLQQQFGTPSKDVAFMEAPAVQDRYEWLKRGRAYYLSIWERAEDQLKLSLWLYGEDAGIVLVEIYERP